jgi:DNA polymerase-3 subunit beta
MKASVAQGRLLEGLLAVQRAVDQHSTVPQLSGVLIRTQKEGIILEGTDSNISIRRKVDAQIHESGAIVVPSKYFVEIVKRIPPVDITFQENNNLTCTVKWNAGECVIHGYSPEEFLSIDPWPTGGIRLPAKALRKLIKETTFAAAREDTRPTFTGMLLQADGEGMRGVCTDGVRLTISRIDSASPEPASKPEKEPTANDPEKQSGSAGDTEGEEMRTHLSLDAIIPARALSEVQRLTSDADEIVAVIENEGVYFRWNDTYLFTRLLSGKFPDYERVIPHNFQTVINVDKDEFRSASDKAYLMTKGVTNPITLEIGENEVTISSSVPGVGEVKEAIEASVQGDPMNIAFNARFLIDGLDVITEKSVVFAISGQEAPCILRPSVREDFIYIVLPLKIG